MYNIYRRYVVGMGLLLVTNGCVLEKTSPGGVYVCVFH